ncbi:MAG: hypothetical protein LAN71_13145 [Acidobacteriia bacterium]|nr:hypothetical protein [Terriglobia bacterium]
MKAIRVHEFGALEVMKLEEAPTPQPSRMCPSGKTKEDTIQNIREAMEDYILAPQEDGPAAPPDNIDAVRLAASKFLL